jgi:hypothetical protein
MARSGLCCNRHLRSSFLAFHSTFIDQTTSGTVYGIYHVNEPKTCCSTEQYNYEKPPDLDRRALKPILFSLRVLAFLRKFSSLVSIGHLSKSSVNRCAYFLY